MPQQLTFDDLAKRSERLYGPDEIFKLADESLLSTLKESRRIERKPASYTGSDLGDYISMWANTAPDGGIIISGMRDNGEYEGCLKLTQEQVNRIEKCYATFCPDARIATKQIEVTLSDNSRDFIIITRVYYNHTMVVHTSSGKVFKRIGDSIKELKGDEIRELQAEKGIISFEKQDSPLSFPDDYHSEAIESFVVLAREAMRYPQRLVNEDVLELRHLGRKVDGKFIPNYACTVLFAKQPRSVLPGCRIHFKRFEDIRERTGKDYNPVKDDVYEGTIAELIEQISIALESQLRVYRPLNAEGKFFPVPEYPREAWLEAIVNACVHRSYGNGMKNIPIYVKMFDDRLEVESPGPFPTASAY